jgi:hypothetical protein
VSIGLVSHPEDGSTVDELMIAADRAMYAAKSLGKNQISGYPRPRRAPTPLPALRRAATAVGPGPKADSDPATQPAATEQQASIELPSEQTVASSGPAEEPEAAQATTVPGVGAAGAASTERNGMADTRSVETTSETDDFDPAEARRRIAALSYDPDHQIRRAMDAFLSAPPPRERREGSD